MNLYRTIQEAVNNAIKHAHPKNITIEINLFASTVQIIIKDDGIGFDESLISKGNGLINMQKRMEEIKGTIKWSSLENGGTQIELQLKNK